MLKQSIICNLGTRVVSNYLISTDLGYILINTGHAGSFPCLQKMLKKKHIPLKEIRYIFLTPAHDDYAGFPNEVLAATDADVILHPKVIKYPAIRKEYQPRLIPTDSERFRALCFPYRLNALCDHRNR